MFNMTFLKLLLIITSIVTIYCESLDKKLELDDYDYDILKKIKRNDARHRFHKKRISNAKDFNNLNETIVKNAVYFDNVPHFKEDENSEIGKKAKKMERHFRKMLAMKGLTYLFKRDTSWRTWREVQFEKKKVIHYRCSNIINGTCRNCDKGGYWIIEETAPQCPYEIFSIIDKYTFCGATIGQFKSNNTCPSVIELSDVSRFCDNPIITDYRITKDYNGTRNIGIGICGGNDYCELTTFYRIYQDYIAFSIANSTNNIIYSKLMTIGKNFICLFNCGEVNPKSRAETKYNNPLIFKKLPRKKKVHKHKAKSKSKKKDKTKTWADEVIKTHIFRKNWEEIGNE